MGIVRIEFDGWRVEYKNIHVLQRSIVREVGSFRRTKHCAVYNNQQKQHEHSFMWLFI